MDSYGARFRQLWSSSKDEAEALRKVQGSLGSTLPGQLVNMDHRATIDIQPDGSATIRQTYRSADVSHAPLMVVSRDLWFEYPQPTIRFRAHCDRSVPLQVELVRDFSNYKQLLCNFVKPLQPLEVVTFSYSYDARAMFLRDHFWDQRVVAPTKRLHVSITHHKGKWLTGCVVSEESQSGLMQDPDPDLVIHQSSEEVCSFD